MNCTRRSHMEFVRQSTSPCSDGDICSKSSLFALVAVMCFVRWKYSRSRH